MKPTRSISRRSSRPYAFLSVGSSFGEVATLTYKNEPGAREGFVTKMSVWGLDRGERSLEGGSAANAVERETTFLRKFGCLDVAG